MPAPKHVIGKSLQVWELATGPLHNHVPVKLHWLKAIPPDRGTKYQRERLIQSMKGLLQAVIEQGGESGPLAAGSINNYFGVIRRIAAWMTERDIWAFRDLNPCDLVDFIAARQAARERSLCENTVWAIEGTFRRMWQLRDMYMMPLRFDPLLVESEIKLSIRTRRAEPWRSLDEDQALPLVKDALDWIRAHDRTIIDMVRRLWAERRSHVGLSRCERVRRVRAQYLGFLEEPAIRQIARQLQLDTSMPDAAINRIMTATEGACVIALLFLVGMRASELLRLETDCLKVVGEPGLDRRAVLSGIAAKRRGMPRTWAASDDVVEVVQFLTELYAEIRVCTGQTALFLGKTSAAPIPLPGRKSVRLGPESLRPRLLAFANSPHRGLSIGLQLHAHMARKTFARFVVMRDKTALESMSYHYGHVHSAITDGAYVGTDIALARLLREEDRADLSDALMDLLSGGAVGGKAGKNITQFAEHASGGNTSFKGKRSLGAAVDRLIDSGVRLAPCNWGYCVYSKAMSACGGDDMGPNAVQRAPDVCATCQNFSVTERHRHYWNERVSRDENFLKRPGLPDQTKQVVLARVARSLDVLASLTPIDGRLKERTV